MKYWYVALLLIGCVSTRRSDQESDLLFQRGQYGQAAARLKKGLDAQGVDGRDLLLYLLDYALTLHTMGSYEESSKYFLQADKLADIKDYTSLAMETATLLVSENTKDYKGEDFEKVLINVYLAMNYALKGDSEDALVEARRVNHKIGLMVSEGKKKYKENAFAQYVSAVLYEANGDFDDARIEYEKVAKKDIPLVGQDLWRVAHAQHDYEQEKVISARYGLNQSDYDEAVKALTGSEIIVLYENGIGPIKVPNPQSQELPIFKARYNPVYKAGVYINDVYKKDTVALENIEVTAIENLREKYGGMVAKKIGGHVAKYLIADQIGRNDSLLGLAAYVALLAADQADCRSWQLLPQSLQVARIALDPGSYRLSLHTSRGVLQEKMIVLDKKQKVFVNMRFTP